MAKSKLRQYKGDLDSTQIADGMNAARRNARRLVDDAKLLLDAGRFPTAAALAVLSIEESGKIGILRHLAFAPEIVDRRKIWKEYRSHRSKNVAWILPSLVTSGARDLDSLRLATDPSAEHTALLDQFKQISLYTDCLGNGNWSEPEKAVDEQVASYLVRLADFKAVKSTTSVTEIDLWRKHLRPVYSAPLEVMKTALLNWFAAMKENGLGEDGNISVEEFVRGKSGAVRDR